MNPFSLEGKNIIITGASSGIGRQCAISCSMMGARIIIMGRRREKLDETLTMMKPANHLVFQTDITDYPAVESAVTDAVGKNGRISGFVHSAGSELIMPMNVTRTDHYRQMLEVNAIAGFELARIVSKKKYSLPEGGSFVFIASVMGFLGETAHSAYCSSKGALLAGSKALALELAPRKIRVNCISPAQIEGTEMTMKMRENMSAENEKEILKMHPSGYGKPEDVANGCIYLLSDASVWVTGTNLVIDGGYSAR